MTQLCISPSDQDKTASLDTRLSDQLSLALEQNPDITEYVNNGTAAAVKYTL